MFSKLNKYTFLFTALTFFVVAAIIENSLLRKHPESYLIEEFQQKLNANEQQLSAKLGHIAAVISSDEFDGNLSRFFKESNLLLKEEGIGFLVYQDGELSYWSERSISFYDNENQMPVQEGLVQLPNGYYIAKKAETDKFHIYGLLLLKYNYRYENKYLKNNFFEAYNLPDEYKIVKQKLDSTTPIFDSDGNYLFSVKPGGDYLCTTRQLYLPGILYLAGLIFLLYYFRREFVESPASFSVRMLGLATALFLVYWLHLIFQIPKVFFYLRFFSPEYFALSNWLPSLGDFFLFALFFLFWMYNFGKGINIPNMERDSLLPRKLIIALLLLFSGFMYLVANYYIEKLIFNSTISFSLNKIIEVSARTGIGVFSIGLFLLGNLYFTVKVVDETRHDYNLLELISIVAGVVLFLGVAQVLSVGRADYEALLMYAVACLLASMFSKNYLQKFTLSYLIIFVSMASLYSLQVIYRTTSQKEREHQKLLAVTLVADRDPTAEVFLSEIQEEINKDSVIPKLLIGDEQKTKDYIIQTYFSGYFRRYDARVFICSGADSLYIEMEDRMAPCYPFFDNMIKLQGDTIPGTHFFFMYNMNGQISYTGKLHYPLTTESQGASIYIELNSDLMFEGIGFPELLIDKSMVKPEDYKKFNFAKYYGGELTDKHGDYNYNFYVDTYISSDNEFQYKKWDGLEHLIYRTPDDNFVIVSREMFTFIDYLISFPYLFVFYFLSVLVFLLIGNRSIRKRPVTFDLKFRIQAAIISIVFVSLLVVAAATIWYNVREYKEKHQNDLNEKMKSIAEEIDMRLNDVPDINYDLEWLHEELIRLSNIFRTDVNIYGNNGDLIASSRSEIFNRGLISTRMNAKAYYEIFENFQISYFQPEKIGELSYLSAYRPIINNKGNYLGVINLPYFIKQDKYSQELSTIIVAFINLYVLLLLASIILAVFIANQITRPLVVIQENLRKIELGKRNEPIRYTRKDEIGSLVKEYNKKVDELAVSAELLARSERESAWREMAKQIAHEIKNPLTPMKLNIQQLQRAKLSGENDDKFLERVTSTLIEQIDNLSNIATEFSNFAKIPTARNQVFNLSAQLQKVIDLFDTHSRVGIEFHSNGLEYMDVNADREQLSRAIINLVKNGIQSIPENRKNGCIKIDLDRRDHMAVIAVSDNGSGIPVDLRDKLFSPSFTTKSSGMGLGLAIVKNIVENFSGTIWFETEMGKGTTFYLEIPVYEKAENQ